MTHIELLQNYPRLYHMAEAGTWASIFKHGLLSTTALLDLFEVPMAHRTLIESSHRPACVTIAHPIHGTAVIRDQKPMRESTLLTCLEGMNPSQWYELLNRRTFFWLTLERLATLLNAKAYRERAHCVITVETAALLTRHEARITLSPINSGSTIYNAPSRGINTFYKIADYPFEQRRKTRGKRSAVAELVVDYSVPDIRDIAVLVEHRRQNNILERIWKRT
jgi:uncharacterized protein DUF7002